MRREINLPKHFVPRDTGRAAIRNNVPNVDNVSLLLQRFAPFTTSRNSNKLKPSIRHAFGRWRLNEQVRKAIKPYARHLGLYIDTVENAGKTFVMKTSSRLVIGLGDESVYETSVRLLRNYGLPYIPGSVLKGIARAWAIEVLAETLRDRFEGDFFKAARKIEESLQKGERKDFSDEKPEDPPEEWDELVNALGLENATPRDVADGLIGLFGTTKEKGSVVFFDALPVPLEDIGEKIRELPRKLESGNGLIDVFDLDIMNPHYGPYYQNGEPPGDWYNPVPVFFLVVREGVPFVFGVGGKNAEVAENLLKLALKHHGVGAKTSLGYGRFE